MNSNEVRSQEVSSQEVVFAPPLDDDGQDESLKWEAFIGNTAVNDVLERTIIAYRDLAFEIQKEMQYKFALASTQEKIQSCREELAKLKSEYVKLVPDRPQRLGEEFDPAWIWNFPSRTDVGVSYDWPQTSSKAI